ncbi:MAG: hypothetical protein ACRDFS_06185, partial [Chloroflexota bacterium]
NKTRAKTRRVQHVESSALAVEEIQEPGVIAAPPPPFAATAVASRPTRQARRLPSTTINYGYLRRDLMTLAVLAPSMVVLVLIAFLFLH